MTLSGNATLVVAVKLFHYYYEMIVFSHSFSEQTSKELFRANCLRETVRGLSKEDCQTISFHWETDEQWRHYIELFSFHRERACLAEH